MLNTSEVLIRLLLATGQHDEVEAEMHSFAHALNAENWCLGAHYWRLVTLWNRELWEVVAGATGVSGIEKAVDSLPPNLVQTEFSPGQYILIGKRFFFRINPELIIEIDINSDIATGSNLSEALKVVLDKFSLHLNRHQRCKQEAERRKYETNPLEQLTYDAELQQRVMATLSHELRNPLNLIIGYSDILLENSLSSLQREYISIVRESGHSLYQTVKKVFQFLHVMVDKTVDEEVDFRIRDVVSSVEKHLKSRALAKGLEWKTTLPEEAAIWLKGDMSKLIDILTYLIENSIKFSSRGAIELIVSYEGISEDDKGPRFGFMLRDQGKGVDVLHQLRIFQFFSQEDESITRNYGGLGLGLSLAEVFVRRLGGNLVLKSAVGQGSIFIFQLSFVQSTEHAKLDAENLILDPSITAEIPILIADDDPYQRKMAQHILKHWKLSFAENGKQAVEHIRQHPDTKIVLMDIRMPEVDGIQATRIIRNELRNANPILAVSGEAIETTMEECFNAGMNAFISKPFERDQLLRTIILHCETLRNLKPQLLKLRPIDRLTGLKGLLVEDNKMIQLLAMRYLRDLECKAQLAPDVETALMLTDQNQFDFILLDLHLSDGTGFEVARKVRSSNQKTCIIAYSGEDSDETRAMCKAAGINGIILKTYHSAQELAIRINHLINEYNAEIAFTEEAEPVVMNDYDLTKVKELIGESTSDLILLLEVFVEHNGTTLNQLLAANKANDLKTLSRQAHSLKSSAKQFGMDRAAELLFMLEQRTGDLDPEERNKMCAELQAIFERTLPEFRQEIERLKN